MDIRVHQRPNHFLTSSSWFAKFPNTEVNHMIRFKSDHVSIVVRTYNLHHRRTRKGKKSFKFESSWLLDESCELVVKNAWEQAEGRTLMEKMGVIAGELVLWNHDKYENLGKKVYDAEKFSGWLKLKQELTKKRSYRHRGKNEML